MLIKHSILYFLGRIIPGLVSLLSLSLYTRLLTVEQYGHYALVMGAVGVVNAVFFQWISLSLGRLLTEHEKNPNTLLSTTFIVFFIVVIVTSILGGAIAWLWPDKSLRWFIVLAVVIGWVQAWFDLNLKIINFRMLSIRYGLINSFKAVLAVSISFGLLHFGFGVIGVLVGLVISLFISTCFNLREWGNISVGLFNVNLFKEIIEYGMPLTITFLLTLILDISDRFLLGSLLDAKAVGIYSSAYDLTQQSLGMLMGIVHLAAFPLVVRALEEKGEEETRNQLKNNFLILLMIALPSTIGLVILANNISFVVLGAEFRNDANSIIVLIALAIFVAGIKSYYFDYSFQLRKKMQGLVWVVLCAAITNVALNLLWIPIYGIVGAAYATLSAFIVGMLVSWYLGRKIFIFPSLSKELYKIILASCFMGGGLWLTMDWRGSIYLFWQITLGFSSYTAFLIILNTSQSRMKLMRYLRWSH